jgi:hypothetical protein
MTKKWLLLGVFGLAFVMNPYLACSNAGESEFSYSEADMKEAALGSWEGSAEIDGESVDFSLLLEQASAKSKTQSVSAPKVQPQCASRSFVKPAGACLTMSELLVVGTLTSVNPALNGPVDGSVVAYKDLGPAELTLHLENGTRLEGRIEKQSLSEGQISAQQSGPFSLSRP